MKKWYRIHAWKDRALAFDTRGQDVGNLWG
jgi:hypothetical protein